MTPEWRHCCHSGVFIVNFELVLHFFPVFLYCWPGTQVNDCCIMVTLKITVTLSAIYSVREKCSYSELFWFAFSRIRTEYGEIRRYSVRMRENADQNNSKYGSFLHNLLSIIICSNNYVTLAITALSATFLWCAHDFL